MYLNEKKDLEIFMKLNYRSIDNMLITYSVSLGTRTFVRVVRDEKNVEKHWLRMFCTTCLL
jgi:cell division protein FtsW (lipid II flippase)